MNNRDEMPKDDIQGRVPYEFAVKKFSENDPKTMCELTGSKFDEEKSRFELRFMGKKIFVNYPQGTVFQENGEEVTSYTVKIIIIRFLNNAKGIPPTGKDITFKEIPSGHVYYNNFLKRTIGRLAKLYGTNIEGLEEKFQLLNATKVKNGDCGYRFEFINNVFMTFIVWRGDSELKESANILFDYNIQYYFDAEDLAVVPDVAIEVINNNGTLPKELGLYQDVIEMNSI